MADNFTAKDSTGTALTFSALESGGIYTPRRAIADGLDVTQGAVADAAATAGSAGTISAKLRFLTAAFAGGLPAALSAQGGLKAGIIDLAGTAIAVGAGAVSAGTQRTTLASDDPAVASLAALTDWDESDRAKVNLIVGQAGIAGGTGVDGATVPRVSLATNVGLPAGTNLLGRVSASLETSAVYNGTTALTPKFAAIAAAVADDNTLVAAVTDKKIRVLALCLVAGAAGNIYFQSGAAGTVIFGGSTNKINLAANGGFVLPFNPAGWFETATSELLNLNASSTGPFSGGLVYVEV